MRVQVRIHTRRRGEGRTGAVGNLRSGKEVPFCEGFVWDWASDTEGTWPHDREKAPPPLEAGGGGVSRVDKWSCSVVGGRGHRGRACWFV